MPRIEVTVTCVFDITINNPNVIDRCVNNEDHWRETFYDLDTPEKVLEHLAVNMGFRDWRFSQLEGWADLPDDAVSLNIVSEWIESTVEADDAAH